MMFLEFLLYFIYPDSCLLWMFWRSTEPSSRNPTWTACTIRSRCQAARSDQDLKCLFLDDVPCFFCFVWSPCFTVFVFVFEFLHVLVLFPPDRRAVRNHSFGPPDFQCFFISEFRISKPKNKMNKMNKSMQYMYQYIRCSCFSLVIGTSRNESYGVCPSLFEPFAF